MTATDVLMLSLAIAGSIAGYRIGLSDGELQAKQRESDRIWKRLISQVKPVRRHQEHE